MGTQHKSATTEILAPGKLPAQLLNRLLAGTKPRSPNVLVGPGIGLDAAVVKFTDRYLAVTSDPITLAADLLAYYCVHVNANDLAVMGAQPQFMTVVCLVPPRSYEFIKNINRDLLRASRNLNVTIIGGHTEITSAVNSPVMVGTMLGRLVSSKPITAAGAKVGNAILMTKHAGLEATAIIARERPEKLRNAGFTEYQIRKAQRLLFRPGISILPEARLAARAGCTAMHDATEGGIITALWELAAAGKVRITIDTSKIPLLPLTVRACKLWNIDPLRAISSGALLTTLPKSKTEALMKQLRKKRIPARIIGEVVPGRTGLQDTRTGKSLEPVQDQIVKLYE